MPFHHCVSDTDIIYLAPWAICLRERTVGHGARLCDHRGGSLLFTNPVRILAREGCLPEHVFSLAFETGLDLFSQMDTIKSVTRQALEQGVPRRDVEHSAIPADVSVSIGTTELGRLKLGFAFRSRPEDAAAIENAMASAVGSWVVSRHSDRAAAEA